MTSGWHVLRVFAGSEFHVASKINDAGFSAYCPTYTTRQRSRYARKEVLRQVERALFPGYLFVRKHERFRKQAFESSRTSLQVFYNPLVSDDRIEAIRATADAASRWRVTDGDFGLIVRGALGGELAKVLRVRGQRAVVDVLRQGHHAVMTLPTDDLERVSCGIDGRYRVAM